jgi:hypothetical protein
MGANAVLAHTSYRNSSVPWVVLADRTPGKPGGPAAMPRARQARRTARLTAETSTAFGANPAPFYPLLGHHNTVKLERDAGYWPANVTKGAVCRESAEAITAGRPVWLKQVPHRTACPLAQRIEAAVARRAEERGPCSGRVEQDRSVRVLRVSHSDHSWNCGYFSAVPVIHATSCLTPI